MRAWERINLTKRIDMQMEYRKESNITNIVNHQMYKMNKRETYIEYSKQPEKNQ